MGEALIWIAIIGVASYRLWRLVGEDSITQPFRDRLDGWPLELVSCPWCLGSWVAFGVTWVTDDLVGLPVPVLVGLAAAVVVGWLGQQI